MGIALIIVGGVVIISVMGILSDILTKNKGKPDKELETRIRAMEQQILTLEERVGERDSRIQALESEVAFVTRLIEDKSR